MPLLPREPFVHPEGLFDRGGATVRGEERWWVLHTRARAEKSVARAAHRNGIAYFLPQYERRWRAEGRTFSAHLPLFPGYVFLYGDHAARQTVLETRLVANAIAVVDQDGLRGDLERVYRLVATGASLLPEEGLAPGDRVVIVDGPLQGFEGKVLRRGKQTRLTIEVEFVRRGVSVEIESRMVRPLARREAVGV